jgi:hypothetical protein
LARLIDLIRNVSKQFERVFLLIDAFDECAKGQQGKIIAMIQELYGGGIHVLITARNHLTSDLTEAFPRSKVIEIAARENDVQAYITQQLYERRTQISSDFQRLLTNTITSQAKGM